MRFAGNNDSTSCAELGAVAAELDRRREKLGTATTLETLRWKSSPILDVLLPASVHYPNRVPQHCVSESRCTNGSGGLRQGTVTLCCDTTTSGDQKKIGGSKKRLNPPLCIVLGMDHTTREAYTAYLAGHAKVRRCR
jgi:hypothetical protein